MRLVVQQYLGENVDDGVIDTVIDALLNILQAMGAMIMQMQHQQVQLAAQQVAPDPQPEPQPLPPQLQLQLQPQHQYELHPYEAAAAVAAVAPAPAAAEVPILRPYELDLEDVDPHDILEAINALQSPRVFLCSNNHMGRPAMPTRPPVDFIINRDSPQRTQAVFRFEVQNFNREFPNFNAILHDQPLNLLNSQMDPNDPNTRIVEFTGGPQIQEILSNRLNNAHGPRGTLRLTFNGFNFPLEFLFVSANAFRIQHGNIPINAG